MIDTLIKPRDVFSERDKSMLYVLIEGQENNNDR